MIGENEQIALVAEKILRYLHIHPGAADTAEGIAQWWLRQQGQEEPIGLVEKALHQLLRDGVMVRTLTRSVNGIYRCSRPVDPAQGEPKTETLH